MQTQTPPDRSAAWTFSLSILLITTLAVAQERSIAVATYDNIINVTDGTQQLFSGTSGGGIRASDPTGTTLLSGSFGHAFSGRQVIAPTAVCASTPREVTLDSDGIAQLDPFSFDAGSSDLDGVIVSRRLSRIQVNCADVGLRTITLTVEDNDGNADSCEAELQVRDATSPRIELGGDDPLVIPCGMPFEDLGATATDVCDGDLTDQIVVGGDTVDTDTLPGGRFTVTYDVADSSGNMAVQVTRTVIVGGEACSQAFVDSEADAGGNGSESAPLTTIAAALALFAPNASEDNPITIALNPGTYAETFELPDYVSLIGNDPGDPQSVRIVPEMDRFKGNGGANAVIVAGEGSEIRNLAIELPLNAPVGIALIQVTDVAATIVNVVLNGADTSTSFGVQIAGAASSDSIIARCTFTRLEQGVRAVESNVNVTRNIFEKINEVAIFVREPTTSTGKGESDITTPLLGEERQTLSTGFNEFLDLAPSAVFIDSRDPSLTLAENNLWEDLDTAEAIDARMNGNIDFEPFLKAGLFGSTVAVVLRDAVTTMPIDGATVQLLSNGSVLRETMESDNGTYLFPSVVPGMYEIEVDASGYRPASERTVMVTGEEDEVPVNIALQEDNSPVEGEGAMEAEGEGEGEVVPPKPTVVCGCRPPSDAKTPLADLMAVALAGALLLALSLRHGTR